MPTQYLRLCGPLVNDAPHVARGALSRVRGVVAVADDDGGGGAHRRALLVEFASTSDCVDAVRALRGMLAGAGRGGVELGFLRTPARPAAVA